jgi:integrase
MSTTPFLHPRTKVYYFRKGVPSSLRQMVGKSEIKISLKTKDLEEAKVAHRRLSTKIERDWAQLSPAPQIVEAKRKVLIASRHDIAALAGEMYREMVRRQEKEPGDEAVWLAKLMELQQALPAREREPGVKQQWPNAYAFLPRQVAPRLVGKQVASFLEEKGVELSPANHLIMCMRAASALAQAYRLLARRAADDFGPDPQADRFPPSLNLAGWHDLYELYCSEMLPDPSTRKRQEGVLRHFFAFLGHELAAEVKQEDALRWKAKRLTEVSRETVRKADLAHPRAFFSWCLEEKKLPTNPFAGITVATGRRANKHKNDDGEVKPVLKKREYSHAEARRVLEATLAPPSKRLTAEGAAARRWIPWLCAYSGARVNEMTQLRFEDIFRSPSRDNTEMIWVVRISPDAGTVKDDQSREVALHPHLLEQGFLGFVESRQGKCLFYDPARGRGGSAANPQYAKVAERLAHWVRTQVGITDPRISPNHAWRHLFRTIMKATEFQPELLDYIDGHAPASEGHKYGKVWPETTLKVVESILPYRFDGREIAPRRD